MTHTAHAAARSARGCRGIYERKCVHPAGRTGASHRAHWALAELPAEQTPALPLEGQGAMGGREEASNRACGVRWGVVPDSAVVKGDS
jgi:hypothetical protein